MLQLDKEYNKIIEKIKENNFKIIYENMNVDLIIYIDKKLILLKSDLEKKCCIKIFKDIINFYIYLS